MNKFIVFGALALATCTEASNILIAGDSWGTEGKRAFLQMLKDNGSNMTVEDIAVSGSTTTDWVEKKYLEKLEKAVKAQDLKVVWVTLMGNDAKNHLPACGAAGGSSDACTQKVVEAVTPNMQTIIETIHNNSAASVRVLGFGYDILGCAKDNGVCDLLPRALYPRCNGDVTCFNTQFEAIQGVWATLARQYRYVDVLNLLGSIQTAAGDPNAAVGQPDLASFSPTPYMQSNCIHPNDKGFSVIFQNLWSRYLSKIN